MRITIRSRRVLQTTAVVTTAVTASLAVAHAASGDQPQRVISSRAHLAAVPVRGGRARVLATGGSYFFVSTPRLSPDGRVIAYGGQRCPNCVPSLNLVSIRGGRPRRLRPSATDPAWSPDGRRIVFAAVSPNGGRGFPLYLVDRSGASPQKLDLEIQQEGESEEVRFFHNPAFARSGKAIAFDAEVEEEEQVFRLDLTTHVAQQLTHNPQGAEQPVFASDGRIVYACTGKNGVRDICIIRPGAARGHRIAATSGDDADPAVSPDGRTVVFSSDVANRKRAFRSLYVVRLSGGTPRRLTRGFNATEPTFTPNGKRIVFVRRALVRSG